MRPISVTPSHVAWWYETPASEPQHVRIGAPPSMPDVAPVDAVVSANPDDPARAEVHIPWQPSQDEVAHLASGGTLWLTAVGGVPPVRLAVQPPDGPPQAWVGRVSAVLDSAAPGSGPTVRLELAAGRAGPALDTAVVVVAEGAAGGPAEIDRAPRPRLPR